MTVKPGKLANQRDVADQMAAEFARAVRRQPGPIAENPFIPRSRPPAKLFTRESGDE